MGDNYPRFRYSIIDHIKKIKSLVVISFLPIYFFSFPKYSASFPVGFNFPSVIVFKIPDKLVLSGAGSCRGFIDILLRIILAPGNLS